MVAFRYLFCGCYSNKTITQELSSFTCKPITMKMYKNDTLMVMIKYDGYNEAVLEAVKQVNNLLYEPSFLNAISKSKHFDLASIPPAEIAELIKHTDLLLAVNLYWPSSLSEQAHTYDDIVNPQILHMNKATLNRPTHSLCNTIVHQLVHALNAAHPGVYFGHGDNNPAGKCNTAPYWIAGLAQRMIAEDETATEQMIHQESNVIKTNKEMQEELLKEGLFCFYDHMAILQA